MAIFRLVPILIILGFANGIKQEPEDTAAEPTIPVPPEHPLFNLGTDKKADNEQEVNSTSEEMPLGDEASDYQRDDAWRQYYWYAYYNYPRTASYYNYLTGSPYVTTLTQSQLAWVNSLHPELRDQYLKGLYVVRADDASDSSRTMAYLTRYDDVYNYYYHAPYLRRSMSSIVDNQASTYDHSCNTAGYPVVPAPNLPNMSIARYDSRKNTLPPHNYYLATVYQCDPGYYLLDWRFSELYCSKGVWVGISPVCTANP